MTEVSQKASTETQQLQELLPKHGVLHQEITPVMALCKPKLLPLKSVTLEKLEKMQKDAQQSLKEQDDKENEEESKGFEQGMTNMAQYPDGHNNDSNSWQPSNSDDARLDGGTSDKNVHDFMSGDGP